MSFNLFEVDSSVTASGEDSDEYWILKTFLNDIFTPSFFRDAIRSVLGRAGSGVNDVGCYFDDGSGDESFDGVKLYCDMFPEMEVSQKVFYEYLLEACIRFFKVRPELKDDNLLDEIRKRVREVS